MLEVLEPVEVDIKLLLAATYISNPLGLRAGLELDVVPPLVGGGRVDGQECLKRSLGFVQLACSRVVELDIVVIWFVTGRVHKEARHSASTRPAGLIQRRSRQ